MKFEESGILALVALVVIVAAVTGTFFYLKYVQTPENVVEEGDCVVVNYIGKYASNGTVFDTSYESVAKENGIYDANRTYEPLKIFVDSSGTKAPPSGYENFSSSMIEGFMEGLIGMKEGETKTVTIPPEKGYGVKPKIGDVINLSSFVGTDYVFKIIDIKENATMPALYQDY
ncbi:MAG: FKBP-type peptidyl-prolyl cis-trans isomerase, partial [Thermoplasmata archaeon]|nr:FKBP-type peptidyl-prolyl cis-trans isomerase [Thermoplasmata archaeon]